MKRIAVLGTGFRREGHRTPPQEILDVAGEGFEAVLLEQRLPAFPVNQINRTLSEVSTIEAGLRAAEEGFDAVFINTVGDYGLAALRSALDQPVVGAGQAGMHLAAQMGARFAIVTVWPPSLRFIYEDLLRLYGMAGHCSGIRCVSLDDELATLADDENFVTRMRAGDPTMQDRIVDQCNRAIADGADTILLGCTCMSPSAAEVAARCAAPVINPLTAGYKAAEALLSLGVAHSRLAHQEAGPPRLPQFGAMADAVIALDKAATRAAAE